MVAGARTLGGVGLNLCDIALFACNFPRRVGDRMWRDPQCLPHKGPTIRRWLATGWTPPVTIDGDAAEAEQTATPAMARPSAQCPSHGLWSSELSNWNS
jgi:hypothetical protein